MILQKEQFDITGMTCSACSTRVEKSVAKLPGIKEVSVNLLKNSMVTSYDESVLDTAGIVQAVEKAGYGAIPKASAQNKSRTTTPAAKPEVSTAQAEYKQMKQRLLLSALFTIPLFYISMGHMMGWLLPSSLLGMENAISFAFTQFLLLIPVVGITYEFNRLVGRHDNVLTRVLSAPGMWLQNFTVNEPDDSMLEVAIEALKLVLPEEKGKDRW